MTNMQGFGASEASKALHDAALCYATMAYAYRPTMPIGRLAEVMRRLSQDPLDSWDSAVVPKDLEPTWQV